MLGKNFNKHVIKSSLCILIISLILCSCGIRQEEISCTYDDANSTLVFSGTGSIDEDWCNNLDWKSFTYPKKIVFTDGITSVPSEMFSYIKDDRPSDIIRSVEFADSVCEIGAGAFIGCKELREVRLPNGLDKIEMSVFMGCRVLDYVVLPQSVQTIEYGAFCMCEFLTQIELSASLTEIGESAFNYCRILEKIVIPEGCKVIGKEAFKDCPKMSEIVIPKSVTNIGEQAFGYYHTEDSLEYDEADIVYRNENFVIKGCKNTAAEKYAKDNGFTFEALD